MAENGLGRTLTCDRSLRRRLLYTTELLAQWGALEAFYLQTIRSMITDLVVKTNPDQLKSTKKYMGMADF